MKRPGLWELPMGTTVREILEEHAGGMRDGVKFRGLLPGGASTPFIVEEHLDTPMDFTDMPKGRQPDGHRHDDRARRPDLSGRHDLEHDALFRAGILRLLHALLERTGMGGADSHSPWRTATGSPATSKSSRLKPTCGVPAIRSAHWRPAPRTLCRAP